MINLTRGSFSIALILIALIQIVMSVAPFPHTAAGHPPPGDDAGPMRLLFSGYLNPDRSVDSVFGYADAHFNYLPKLIRWGAADTLADDPGNDGASRERPVKETAIAYPSWEGFAGSVAFQRFNRDTLPDIILYMWGKTGDAENRRDTMRAVVIFGQKQLGRVAAVDLGEIGVSQKQPFVAMELRVGSELVDPKARDISGRQSYELLRVDIDVEDADTTGRSAPLAGMADAAKHQVVRVYPNPAGTAVRVEGSVREGLYHVEFIASHGAVARREKIEVDGTGRLMKALDVRRLPSGHYVVRIEQEGRVVGSYPVIIAR